MNAYQFGFSQIQLPYFSYIMCEKAHLTHLRFVPLHMEETHTLLTHVKKVEKCVDLKFKISSITMIILLLAVKNYMPLV